MRQKEALATLAHGLIKISARNRCKAYLAIQAPSTPYNTSLLMSRLWSEFSATRKGNQLKVLESFASILLARRLKIWKSKSRSNRIKRLQRRVAVGL